MPVTLHPYAAAIRAFNALLSREPWARERLLAHAGKRVRLVFGAIDVTLRITAAGRAELAPAAGDAPADPPDVTLTVATDRLPALLSGDVAQRMSAVRIDGDAALAQAVGDLARDLRWDAEDDLSRLIGDIPAARVSAAASSAWQGLRGGAWRLAENLAEYVSEESRLVASRYELEAWSAEVRRLRDDAERAAKRAGMLRARLDRLPDPRTPAAPPPAAPPPAARTPDPRPPAASVPAASAPAEE